MLGTAAIDLTNVNERYAKRDDNSNMKRGSQLVYKDDFAIKEQIPIRALWCSGFEWEN